MYGGWWVYCNRQELLTFPEHLGSLPFHWESMLFVRCLCIFLCFVCCRFSLRFPSLYIVLGCWFLIAPSIFLDIYSTNVHVDVHL